ncbi:MAG TPA: SpoIID/LytB domain-containing protein [Candidatus Limnocylindrales bacterium]
MPRLLPRLRRSPTLATPGLRAPGTAANHPPGDRPAVARPPRASRAAVRAAIAVALLAPALFVAQNAGATGFVPLPPRPVGQRSARPTAPTPVSGAVTFYGRGNGHGVGLSQYGARGRADAGQLAPAILAHYYPGTTLGTLAAGKGIRVLVLEKRAVTAAGPLVIHGRLGTWKIDTIAATFPADAALRLAPTVSGGTVTWRLRVVASDGTELFNGPPPVPLRARPATGSIAVLQLDTKPSSFDRFRGVLRVIASTTAATVDVVNELPLETYLQGVVASEMPSTWHPQALRAQAIVARGYAARRITTSGTFDVYDDTRSQVYRGVLGEQKTTTDAITATATQVLKFGTTIANTLFHSTGGAATENNENVFVSATGNIVVSPVSYLRGSVDRKPDGTPYDASSPWMAWQTKTYSVAQLSAWFGSDGRTSVGTLTAIDLRRRGVSGRLIGITLIGTAGSKSVSGDVFRSVFNASKPAADPILRSNNFDVAPIR